MADSTPSLRRRASALLLALLALVALPALAFAGHDKSGDEHHHAAASADLAVILMGDFDRTSSRLVDLASAIPADHYEWRPAEGVRSVSEALAHVAAGNWGIGQSLGAEPEGGTKTREELQALENVVDRDEVIQELVASIAFAKEAIEESVGKDPDEKLQLFGSEMPRSRVLIILDTHMHEHLGQMIAYARSNGIAPPWSQ